MKSLPYIIIAGLLLFIFISRSCDDSTEQTVDIVEKQEVTIDSLTTQVRKLKELPPDTIYVEKVKTDTVYKDTIDNKPVEVHESSYSDSLITARWSTAVAGELVSQDFWYVPRATPVIHRTTTKYVTLTKTITKTITNYPKGYLSAGLMVGGNAEQFLLAPKLSYVRPSGLYLSGGYELNTGSPVMEVGVKISIYKLIGL